jgi:F-box/leucine-rich repeat protein 2/20
LIYISLGISLYLRHLQVSKSWQSLVFDGQLWSKLNLSAFPKMPAPLLLRLAQAAGPFIKDLDLSGNTHLLSAMLIRITDELCPKVIIPSGVGDTQLTAVNLQGCTALTTRALHHLLMRCPSLQSLCLKGLNVVTNNTFEVLAMCCPNLISLDMSRCPKLDGEGVRSWISALPPLPLKELRLSGIKRITDDTMKILGKGLPNLEVLDLSYVSELHNSAIDAFVSCDDFDEQRRNAQPEIETVLLTSRQAGRDPASTTRYRRRVTRLRHLSLSSCVLLTDIACSHLAHSVPQLEYLELAGIGTELKDDGLVRLLGTTPRLRRLDLEDASDISDAVLVALTPEITAESQGTAPASEPALLSSVVPAGVLEPGHWLEELVISYAANMTDDAMRALVRACPRLRVLEVDNTRISGTVLKEFVKLTRVRGLSNARAVAIDCRGVGEAIVKELSGSTRPRLGWRAYNARKLAFLDARDGEDLKVGQDECDQKRVVLKSFYSWQTVDAVRAAREKRRKSSSRRGGTNESTGSTSDSEESVTQPNASGRARWWSPSGRSGGSNPSHGAESSEREGCRIM